MLQQKAHNLGMRRLDFAPSTRRSYFSAGKVQPGSAGKGYSSLVWACTHHSMSPSIYSCFIARDININTSWSMLFCDLQYTESSTNSLRNTAFQWFCSCIVIEALSQKYNSWALLQPTGSLVQVTMQLQNEVPENGYIEGGTPSPSKSYLHAAITRSLRIPMCHMLQHYPTVTRTQQYCSMPKNVKLQTARSDQAQQAIMGQTPKKNNTIIPGMWNGLGNSYKMNNWKTVIVGWHTVSQ